MTGIKIANPAAYREAKAKAKGTECCGATGKGGEGPTGVVCRACYRPLGPIEMNRVEAETRAMLSALYGEVV